MRTGTRISTLFLALLILAGISSKAMAGDPSVVHVSAHDPASQSLSHHFQIFIDEARTFIPEDILTPPIQNQFQDMAGDDVYSYKRGHFWLRTTLHNDEASTQEFRLVHGYSYSDQIHLYRLEGKQLVPIAQRGDRIPSWPEANDYRLPAFHLQLAPGPTTFYIRFDTLGPVNLKFSIMTAEKFTSVSRLDYLLLGVLFGFVVVMVGYNIFLAARLRNPSYYLYVGYIACFGVVQLLFTGTAQYLLPDSSLTRILLNHGIVISAELTAIFGSLFALSFLNIKEKSPLLYKIILGFYPLSVFDIFLPFFQFDLSIFFVLLTNSYISVVLLMAGIQGCLRGYRPAYFYLAAWGLLIVGSMITMGRIYGLLPDNAFTTWSQFGGGALEVILLSLAMGDKMSLIQEEAHKEISKLASNLNLANAQLQNHIENVQAIVEEKTRDIKSMLANIQQGIFMISAEDGMILPDYSDHLTTILSTRVIAGRSVRDILFSRSDLSLDRIDQSETVIMSALGDSELNFEVNQDLLVHELLYTLPKGEKILELEWSPIVNAAGLVEKMLVTVRDVTQLRELQHQQQQQQRELEAIGKVLKVPADKFNNFLATCEDFMGSCQKTLNSEKFLNLKSINLVFMNVHTMKGMARTFHLDDLATALHQFESQLEPFRSKKDAMLESNHLLSYLQNADIRIRFYAKINSEKLGRKPQTKADQDQHAWIRNKVQKLRSLDTDRMNPDERDVILQVIEGLEQRYGLNLERTLETVLHGLPATANFLGKPIPQIIFEHDEILFTSEGQVLAERIFIHLLNNSLDHGIESVETRKQLGKPRRGEIRINTWMEHSHLLVSIQDDGVGLDLKKIHKKAMDKRLFNVSQPAIQDLANLIFEAGFSTKDESSITSGRGVGMDAVRTYLINSNSTIEIQLLDPQRQRGDLKPIPFRFIMRLDTKLFLPPSRIRMNQVA